MGSGEPVIYSSTPQEPLAVPGYRFKLFGRFAAFHGDDMVIDLERSKAQDLLCYLLLHRGRPHHREDVASVFWGDFTTAQSRKYLRHAIWQLQKALDQASAGGPQLLLVEPEWVHLNEQADTWLDVEVFEQGFNLVKSTPSMGLEPQQDQALREAIALYSGHLLQGWYQDWCVFERERLESIYMLMLDKVMDHCEVTRVFEEGIAFGTEVLRVDRSREVTHRRLIRLFYLAGDRTAALHQYFRCTAALEQELGVTPSARTSELYELVKADRWETVISAREEAAPRNPAMDRLSQVHSALCDIKTKVADELNALERMIQTGPGVVVGKSPVG
jgi:DNA-binding SARP family transcriptional activator